MMAVGISKPLTRQQGDLLNSQRMTVANLTAAAFTAAGSAVPFGGALVKSALGIGGRASALKTLPTYHAGDIIISLDAQVSGGIGPQHSMSSMIIKVQGG